MAASKALTLSIRFSRRWKRALFFKNSWLGTAPTIPMNTFQLTNRFGHRGHTGDNHFICHTQVAGKIGRAAYHTIFTNNCTTRDTDTAGNNGMRPNAHIMTNLNQVIEFNPIFNHGITHRSAVYGGYGADIDIIPYLDTTQLGTLCQTPFWLAKPKPSLPTTTPLARRQRLPIVT